MLGAGNGTACRRRARAARADEERTAAHAMREAVQVHACMLAASRAQVATWYDLLRYNITRSDTLVKYHAISRLIPRYNVFREVTLYLV